MPDEQIADYVRAKKGDQWVGYADRRPAERVFIEVTRVARDGSWVDIRCLTWACMWAKRMKGEFWPPTDCSQRNWDGSDLFMQEQDWEAKRAHSDGLLHNEEHT